MTPAAAQKTDSLIGALLDGPAAGSVRRRLDSFKVDVRLAEDPPTHNAPLACNVALNLLPRLLKHVRYEGPESALGGLPHSHLQLLNFGGDWDASATLVFGREKFSGTRNALYAGSSGWSCYLSAGGPCPWVPAVPNALGAMHAGALAVGEVFKMLAREARPETAARLEYDLVTHGRARQPVTDPPVPEMVDLGDLTVVGCGAIGQALCYALSAATGLAGRVTLLDPDNFDESNEQRYMTMFEGERGMPKVMRAGEILSARNPPLRVNGTDLTYEAYMETADARVSEVAVCVDNVKTRLNAQAALPRTLWNGWTDVEPGSLRYGVSRHSLAGSSACLACYYRPGGGPPSGEDMEASKTGLSKDRIREIRARGEPCSRGLLAEVARGAGMPLRRLLPFEGRPFGDLLHGDCGVFSMRPGEPEAPTPAPHQPALAGILLASQLILERLAPKAAALRSLSDFDALRVPGPLCLVESKRHPDCFCNDPAYRRAYERKWADWRPG